MSVAARSKILRIGMIAPPWFEVPPRAYGGTEAVVAGLVDGLTARGHEVVLVASGIPGTNAAQHVTIYQEPPSALLGSSAMPEVIHAAGAARALDDAEVQIVHDHSLAGPLLAGRRPVRTVTTMHGPVSGEQLDYFMRLGADVDVVAISNAQRLAAPTLNWVGTVYNAVDVPSFSFQPSKADYLLWIGRFHPDKGAHLAIDAAEATGRRLVLAGKLSERNEIQYFREAIAPRLRPDVEYAGEVDAQLKRELFANAACLVFPIQWEEPFGMVMIEAMACGTPVVATRRGSVPEVIADGETGIIVDAPGQLPAAIEQAVLLDPAACRTRAEAHFDLPVMAEQYERVYRKLIELGSGTRLAALGQIA